MLNKDLYKPLPSDSAIESWGMLYDYYNNFHEPGTQWIFRGQRNSKNTFKTSLERAILDFGLGRDQPKKCDPQYEEKLAIRQREALRDGLAETIKGEIIKLSASELEDCLLGKFKRQCHHFTKNVPKDGDIIEWLALMRHHGAPTRLLDWTYSFFVALYFAIEHAENGCAVWALNADWLDRVLPCDVRIAVNNIEELNQQTFEKLFRKEPRKLVASINPFRLNERLVIQQGVFLFPGDISKPFDDNLVALLINPKEKLIKYTIKADASIKREILYHLHRMNINRATLFPGLDGFAQSLKTLLAFPEILK